VVPWRGRVDAPALMRSARQAVLLSIEPGRLVEMAPQGSHVAEGQVIYRLESIEVEHDVAKARAELEQALADEVAGKFNPERRRDQQAMAAQAAEAAATLAHAQSRAANLQFRAPFGGEVRDIPADLRVGDDIRRLERLGVLVSPAASVVEAYVAESDLDRVVPGAHARFIPIDGPSVPLVVSEVAGTSTQVLEVPELASVYGGAIPVRRSGSSSGPLVPDFAIYRVLLVGAEPLPPTVMRTAGEVVIEAPARSAIVTLYRRALAVLLREAAP
jgi:putative peptide zinc metalloprotease protein